jgi:LPS-assembly protein
MKLDRKYYFLVSKNNLNYVLCLLLFIAILISTNSYAQTSSGPLGFCPIRTDIPPRPLVTESLQLDDIFITANYIDYIDGEASHLNGNAELKYNEQQVRADSIKYDEPQNSVELMGNVNYWDNDVYINSPDARINLDTDTGDFSKVEYWLLGNRGRGNANQVSIDLGTRTEGQKVDYTTCDPDLDSPWNLTTNVWKLSASKLVLDHERDRGSGTHVVLKIKDIPVFYTPYISFPTSDRRKSGLLAPTFGSSSRYGAEFQIPYYWNINPQMDATITPRFISKSGLMMVGEYRYLFKRSKGSLNIEYLPDDSVHDGKDRNSIAFEHRQSFLDNGRVSLIYNRVSDKEYLEDFSSTLIGTSTRFLRQSAIASYAWFSNGHRLSINNQVGNYQIVDRNIPVTSRPYKRLPSTTVIYTSPYKDSKLYYKFIGKFDHFDRGNNVELNSVNGIRYDLFPSVSYPINNQSYYVIPKAGVRYTSYQLNQNTVFNNRKPDRFVPLFSMNSGMFFERNTNILGNAVLQTLEPRIFYLYIPEHSQTDLPVFDSGQYNLNFTSLFYENRFSGIDRIGDTNQVSIAVTSRLYSEKTGQYLGSFSLGQAVYLEDRNVILPGRLEQKETTSPIIASLESNLIKNLDIRGEFQWDPDLKRTQKLTISTQYRPGEGKVLNIGYRKHLADPNIRTLNQFNVDQTDISFKWPVNREWNVVGKWNFAAKESRTLDLFAGVEYSGCCWGMRAVGRRFLSSLGGEYDTGFFLQFELKGLAGLGEKTVDFLRMSIPGYQSKF